MTILEKAFSFAELRSFEPVAQPTRYLVVESLVDPQECHGAS